MYSSCPSNRQCISRQQPSRASKTSISSGWLLMTPFTVTNIRISLAFAWLFFFTIIAQFQSACMSTFKPTQILQHVQLYNPVVLSCKYTNLFTIPQLRLELPTALCKYRYQRINGFRRQLRLVGSSGQVAPIVLCPSKVSDFFQDSFKVIEFIKSLIYVICPFFFRLNPHCNSNSLEGSKFEFSKINPPSRPNKNPPPARHADQTWDALKVATKCITTTAWLQAAHTMSPWTQELPTLTISNENPLIRQGFATEDLPRIRSLRLVQ